MTDHIETFDENGNVRTPADPDPAPESVHPTVGPVSRTIPSDESHTLDNDEYMMIKGTYTVDGSLSIKDGLLEVR